MADGGDSAGSGSRDTFLKWSGWAVAIVATIVACLSLIRDTTGYTFSGSTDIHVDQRSGSRLDWCTTFTGTAPVRSDSQLWFAIHDTDGDGRYYYVQINQASGTDQWNTGKHQIGSLKFDTGHQFEVYFFYVKRDAGDFLASLSAVDGQGQPAFWNSKSLPSFVNFVEPFRGTRSPDSGVAVGENCP